MICSVAAAGYTKSIGNKLSESWFRSVPQSALAKVTMKNPAGVSEKQHLRAASPATLKRQKGWPGGR